MQTPQSTSQSTITGGGDPVTPSAATSVETPPSLEAFLSSILVDTLNKPPEYLRDTLASFIEQDVATVQLLASLIGHTANFANQVYYKVVWQGQDEPTWQKYADIPPGSRSLVNQYNRTNKRGAHQ